MSETSEDYDPFDQFSRAQGAGVVEDPYPEWIKLRKQAGVIEADPAEFGTMALLGAGDGGVFLAVSYEAVQQVYAGYVYGDSTSGQRASPLGRSGGASSNE